jgi:hypothetical protein
VVKGIGLTGEVTLRGVKGSEARNILFDILFSLDLPVYCPSLEPPEKNWNLRAVFTDAGADRLNR